MVGNISRALFALLLVAGIVLVLDNRATAASTENPGLLPRPIVDEPLAATKGEQIAVFAGGCFWGVEAVFQHVRGVKSAESGYTGGSAVSPTYEQVTTGTTGHAEAVRVVYDPSRVTYGQLLRVFSP